MKHPDHVPSLKWLDMTEVITPGVPGRYWHSLEDGRIQCDICPRFCKLHEGQRGLCFVRARHGDQIVLTTYGRSSGFCIDPIEKKPLNHFLPGTPVLSFGTAGCNLTCKFCQNWDISNPDFPDGLVRCLYGQKVASIGARGDGQRSGPFRTMLSVSGFRRSNRRDHLIPLTRA